MSETLQCLTTNLICLVVQVTSENTENVSIFLKSSQIDHIPFIFLLPKNPNQPVIKESNQITLAPYSLEKAC